MEKNPLTVLSDFLNRPNKLPRYSISNEKTAKKHITNYIDSIVNDNNFISTYSKAYQIKKQAKRIEAVSLIQKWFKKLKYQLKFNKERKVLLKKEILNGIKKTKNSKNDKNDEEIIKKIIKNQAAIKIQRFFLRRKAKMIKNVENIKKTSREEIQELMISLEEEIQENNDDKNVDFIEIDGKIMQKVTTYFYFQNSRLKQENEHIKFDL